MDTHIEVWEHLFEIIIFEVDASLKYMPGELKSGTYVIKKGKKSGLTLENSFWDKEKITMQYITKIVIELLYTNYL